MQATETHETGHHALWVRRELDVDDPERIAIRKALASGKLSTTAVLTLA